VALSLRTAGSRFKTLYYSEFEDSFEEMESLLDTAGSASQMQAFDISADGLVSLAIDTSLRAFMMYPESGRLWPPDSRQTYFPTNAASNSANILILGG